MDLDIVEASAPEELEKIEMEKSIKEETVLAPMCV